MFWWFGLLLAGQLVALAAAVAFERGLPSLPRGGRARRDALVSVVVPARDEEGAIGACVRALLAQDHARLEVIVVDDGSSDGTAAIVRRLAAADPRVRLVRGRPLRRGWLGKANAVDHGASLARGGWILFVDADTTLAPDALARALAAAEAHGASFLSLWPRQRAESVWERRIQPWVVGLAAVANALQRLWREPFPAALSAWGQFILVEAGAYRDVGGHAAVRDLVLEDYELAVAFRRRGHAAVVFDGRDAASVRMYDGLGPLWRGWTKNLFSGLGHSLFAAAAVAAYVLLLALGPLLAVVLALVTPSAATLAGAFAAVALQAALGLAFARRVDVPPARRPVAASPLGGAAYALMLIDSAYRHLARRPVRWKGRPAGGHD